MFRVRVCWRRHRTAAAFSRGGALFSGCVPEKMLRPVSWDAAVYLMITAGAESWWLVFAASAGSTWWWATGRWMSSLLTGEQRSAHKKSPIDHQKIPCGRNFSKYYNHWFNIRGVQQVIAEPFCCSMDLIWDYWFPDLHEWLFFFSREWFITQWFWRHMKKGRNETFLSCRWGNLNRFGFRDHHSGYVATRGPL